MPFQCSICGEESTRICARCTKDACDNHLCEKCRRWNWNVQGRVAFGREIVAYVMVSAATLLALSLATAWTHAHVQGIPAGHGIRVLLVTGSYFGVLAALYGLRFFLYEFWIFSGRSCIRA